MGGAGGNVYGTASSTMDSVGLFLYGGTGGKGELGANGGNGARVTLNAQEGSKVLYRGIPGASPEFYGPLFRMSLGGGNGGFSDFGAPGRGGDAELDLDFVAQRSLLHNDRFHFSPIVHVTGGNGGGGLGSSSQKVSGLRGAYSLVRSREVFRMLSSSVKFEIKAVGGDGGSALGAGNTGNGGDGGLGILDRIVVDGGESAAVVIALPPKFKLTQTGGNGGVATAGTGGAGASITMDNPLLLTGNWRGPLRIDLIANGGNGGNSEFHPGRGGNAFIKGIGMAGPQQATQHDELRIEAVATSGYSGFTSPAGNSGSAAVELVQTSNASFDLIGAAIARETSGTQGFTFSRVAGETLSLNGMAAGRVTAATEAKVDLFHKIIPRIGGTAHAVATGLAKGLSSQSMNVSSGATAGQGVVKSGSAFAFASSMNTGQVTTGAGSSASADSRARSFADDDRSFDNSALSIANAHSAHGLATAKAKAESGGEWSRSVARASATGTRGNATAASSGIWSRVSGFDHSFGGTAEVGSTTYLTPDGTPLGSAGSVQAAALFSVGGNATLGYDEPGFASSLIMVPEASGVATAVPTLDPDAALFAWGLVTDQRGLTRTGETRVSNTEFSFFLPPEWQSRDLFLNFIDFEGNFPGLQSGHVVLETSLSGYQQTRLQTADEVVDYYSQNSIYLGNTGHQTRFSFRMNLAFSSHEEADNFRLRYLLADQEIYQNTSGFSMTTIPEPSLPGLLFWISAITILVRRRATGRSRLFPTTE